ncbi:MAG: SPOR domain-containing protein [Bacteroidales bacterium]|nr:SPOR domain-containing protein [Bacteroidales bacterium]
MLRFVFIVFILFSFNVHGIKAQVLKPADGKVEIVQDEKIIQLTEQYKRMSLSNPEVEGYRVQIFFDSGSNSKNTAATTKLAFETVFPETKSYLSYKEPYYRVRVGDFRTLVEAVGFQKKIAVEYPNSFPVKDKIVQ